MTNQVDSVLSDHECQGPVLRNALKWVDAGACVIPLLPKSKIPNSSLLPKGKDGKASWTPLRQHPATREMVEQWFAQDPQINYGIVCGQASGIVAVDIDHKDKLPPGLILVPSYMVFSGREGRAQVYYHHSGPLKSRSFPWGDLKADGGYIVGPGSIHPSGTIYEALDEDAEIVEMPPGLLEALVEGPNCSQYGSKPSVLTTPAPIPSSLHRDWRKEDATSTEYSVLVASRSYPKTDREKAVDVRSYFCSPEIAIRAMHLMGYDEADELGKHFRCPWHDDDAHPSAALFQGEDSQVFVHDFHSRGHKKGEDPEWLTLPDVYAKWVSGQASSLSHAGYCVWGIRLLAELGEITLPEIETPDLPDDAPRSVEKLWDGFCHLLRVREFYLPHQDGTPFSFGFGVSWCHFDDKTAVLRAFDWLQKNGLVTALPKQRKSDATMYIVGTPVEETVEDAAVGPVRVKAVKLSNWRRSWRPGSLPVPVVLGDLASERSGRDESD